MQFGSQGLRANFSRITALFLSLVLSVSFSAHSAQGAGKKLVFVTVDGTSTSAAALETYASLPNIDGLGLELQWWTLEPQSGKYDWSKVDNAIRIAATHKKYVTLYIMRSPKPPDWLTEGGKTQTFFSGTITRGLGIDPIPWDKVFLASYVRLLQAAALHFKSLNMTPYIFAVGTVAPERDCTIEGSRNGMLGTTAYDRNKYLLACEQMIDSYARIFPTARQFVATPSDELICLPQRDHDFFQELMTYAVSKHRQGCWLFARDLSSAGSRNSAPYVPTFNRRTGIAYQIGAATAEALSPDNFSRAVTIGLENGAIYFEIAPTFATSGNPLIQQAIDRIRRN